MQPASISGLDLPVDQLADLCRRYKVKELFIFGSATRGELRPDSDIDVLVEFLPEAHIGLVKFASLIQDLQDLLGRRVDLVTKSGLKPRVRPRVLSEARLVFAA